MRAGGRTGSHSGWGCRRWGERYTLLMVSTSEESRWTAARGHVGDCPDIGAGVGCQRPSERVSRGRSIGGTGLGEAGESTVVDRSFPSIHVGVGIRAAGSVWLESTQWVSERRSRCSSVDRETNVDVVEMCTVVYTLEAVYAIYKAQHGACGADSRPTCEKNSFE